MSDKIILNQEQTAWVEETWEKVVKKMKTTVPRNFGKIPGNAYNGMYDNWAEKGIDWWTNGFWPGLNWLLYTATGDELYKKTAEKTEEQLDEALHDFDKLHHDVGFMWHISSGLNYRLTGNERSKSRALTVASVLAARYNLNGKFIRAWNGDPVTMGWAIIDCMMNLTLLYWASDVTGDPRFRYIAESHADTAMQYHVRPDGSVKHIVEYDPITGEYVREHGGQGYGEGSAWSRGQAWGIYGFVLSYIHTGKVEYLDTAKRIANYFVMNVCDDYLPKVDFRAPAEPVLYDSSAGVIAACGLIEISKAVPEYEGKAYLNAALNILKALEKNFCDWSADTDAILGMCTGRYEDDGNRHIGLVYGDFYFVEALLKLKNCGELVW